MSFSRLLVLFWFCEWSPGLPSISPVESFANLIDFIIITAVVYFIFKRLGLEKLDVEKKKI